MQNIFTRQIIRLCNFCRPCRLFIALRFHNFGAFLPKLNSCKGVNGVVDTTVIRAKATEHLRISGVNYPVAFQRCNIALPKVYVGGNGRKVGYIRYAFEPQFFLQILVLNLQKFFTRTWGTEYKANL